MSNPFAAFSIQIGSAGVQAGLPAADPKGAVREHALALKKGESGRFAALDELPGDWWSLAENEPGGYGRPRKRLGPAPRSSCAARSRPAAAATGTG